MNSLSDSKYRLLLENSPVMFFTTDLNGTITYVNPYFCRLTGYSVDEVLGKNPRILKSGVHGESFYKQMWDSLSNLESFSSEVCNKRKDGSLFWVDTKITPIIEASEVVGYLAVQTDITEKRQTELEYQVILESMEGCVAILDKERMFIKILPHNNWWGIPEEQLIGAPMSSAIEKDYYEELSNAMDAIDAGIIGPHISYMKIEIDNTPRTIENVIRRFNSNKFVVWGRDITDKLKLRVLNELKANIDILVESNNILMDKLGVNIIDEGIKQSG